MTLSTPVSISYGVYTCPRVTDQAVYPPFNVSYTNEVPQYENRDEEDLVQIIPCTERAPSYLRKFYNLLFAITNTKAASAYQLYSGRPWASPQVQEFTPPMIQHTRLRGH